MIGIDSLIKAGTDLITSYFPPDMSPAQKAEAQAKLAEMQHKLQNELIAFEANMEQQLTERQKADMSSDSWLSKNVRPLVLIYLMLAWTVFAGLSLFAGSVAPEYVEMLKQMLMAAFGFYFVGRSAEKIVQIVKGIK